MDEDLFTGIGPLFHPLDQTGNVNRHGLGAKAKILLEGILRIGRLQANSANFVSELRNLLESLLFLLDYYLLIIRFWKASLEVRRPSIAIFLGSPIGYANLSELNSLLSHLQDIPFFQLILALFQQLLGKQIKLTSMTFIEGNEGERALGWILADFHVDFQGIRSEVVLLNFVVNEHLASLLVRTEKLALGQNESVAFLFQQIARLDVKQIEGVPHLPVL